MVVEVHSALYSYLGTRQWFSHLQFVASTVTPDLVIAILAPGKGRGLEKVAQLDGQAKPGRSLQHASTFC